MAAPMEYEVREEYQTYSIPQLLEAPVTCFQGVGDTQSELLERYFSITTVRELAHLPSFLEALSVQEKVLEGGAVLKKTVAEAGQEEPLNFHVRAGDQLLRISDLPDAPVHVLEGLTPGQDLALYDAFRITNVTQLAQNRIMLEARIIDFLSREVENGEHTAGQDAIASILGQRAATAAAGRERAQSDDFSDTRMHETAEQVSDHVRDRVEAMRGRARGGPAATREGVVAAGAGGTDRLSAIREGRERGAGERGEAVERTRGGGFDEGRTLGRPGLSRAEQIMASRGGAGIGADAATTVAERRAQEGMGRPSSRADSVTAARASMGRGGPPASATGGAYVKSRADTAKDKKEKEAAEKTLATEEEAAAKAAAEAEAAAKRRPPPRTNPMPLIAAAAVVVIVLIGLVAYLMSGGTEQAPGTGETGTQTAEQGQPGSAPGEQGAPSAAVTPPPPPRIKAVHTVQRGESLWRISRQQYADPLNWPTIFMENQDQISHPDLIHPAQEFRIPTNPEYRFPDYPEGYRRTR